MKQLNSEEFKFIRYKSGMTLKEMALWLGKDTKYAEKTIRRWEEGYNKIPNYVTRCFEGAGYLEYLKEMPQQGTKKD